MPGFTMNQVSLSGNLTRDPELRQTPSGASVCGFGLAVNERIKNSQTSDWEDRANFFRVTIWGGIGEWVANNVKKGDQIALSGRLRWHSWEKDGQKREQIEVVADSIVPSRSSDGNSRSSRNSSDQDVPFDAMGLPPGPSEPAQSVMGMGGDDDVPF